MNKIKFSIFIPLLLIYNVYYPQGNNSIIFDSVEVELNGQPNSLKVPSLASTTTFIQYSLFLEQTTFYGFGDSIKQKNDSFTSNSNLTYDGGYEKEFRLNFDTKSFQSRNPILILNNSAFGPSGYNFPGTGTIGDPYIIEGYNITDSSKTLIEVDSTSVYYVIRDNHLNGINKNYPLMRFNNTTNGTIQENILVNGQRGIFMNRSDYNTFSENTIWNNTNGIYTDNCSFNLFTNNKIYNNTQFGFYLGLNSNYNNISRNNIYNNTYLGLFIYSSDNTTVDRNNFLNNYPSGVSSSQTQDNGSDNVFIYNYWADHAGSDSDGNGYVDVPYFINGTAINNDSFPLTYPFAGYIPFNNITITSNSDFGPSGYDFPGSGIKTDPYIIEGYNITYTTSAFPVGLIDIRNTDAYFIIRQCLLDGINGSNYGIYFDSLENGTIDANTIHSTTYGVSIGSSSKNNTITSNFIYNSTLGGIVLAGTDNNTVYKNTIDNSNVYGVRVLGSDNNTLVCNFISNSSNGISVSSSSNNYISTNIIQDTYRAIFVTQSSEYTNITNNTVYNNDYGIWIQNLAANNNISHNNASFNNYYGIYLSYDSENNTISYNLVLNNTDYGIYLGSNVNYSIIKWNNFFANNQGNTQGYDFGLNNIFNYNYWDDLTSPDTTPIDGYVDTPYNIDGGINTDPYARVYPLLPHNPIYIDDNADFGTLGFPGDGTKANPYVIEGYFIINSTANLIEIQDTTAYFIIRYNFLDAVDKGDTGMALYNIRNGTIANNSIQNGNYGILMTSGVSGNFLINNTVSYCNTGIRLDSNSNNNDISGNRVFSCTFNGIRLDNSYDNNISKNILYSNLFGLSIASPNSENNIISENDVYNNNNVGIELSGTTRQNYFYYNEAYNNTQFGFALNFCSNSTFSYNLVYQNDVSGFYLWNAENITLTENSVYNNVDYGFDIGQSANNSIQKNYISDQGDYGIILLSTSGDNEISLNRFINNNQSNIQASDAGSNNIFNYNYWDDWTSPDTTPIDGYVDTPYNIDGGSNTDPYARVYPFLPHNPIYIDEDADFATLGFLGQGTIKDPYLIEEYFIINSTTTLIHIQDTTAYFLIRNNILNGVNGGYYGINLYNVINGVIINNTIHSGDRGISIDSSLNINITSNFIFNESNQGIFLFRSNTMNLSQNDIYNITANGIYLSSTNGSLVSENTIKNCSQNGISLFSTYNNKISKNDIFNNSQYGIYIDSSHNNTINNNFIFNNSYGIVLVSSSTNDTILNNTIYNNIQSGIYLSPGVENKILNNTIHDNGFAGIFLGGNCENNTFSGNVITNQTGGGDFGIYLGPNAKNNTVKNNTMYDNWYGIYLENTAYNNTIFENTLSNSWSLYIRPSSGFNRIYLNNFLSTVRDDNGTNLFYYKGLGNYWGSSYTGSDINGDGVGDTPHIFTSNQDIYPLMHPIDWYSSYKITFIDGGWNVNSYEIHQNEIITLNGNLLVGPNGNLTLDNVILRFNSSTNDQYRLEVYNGGNLTIIGRSVVTTINISSKWYLITNTVSYVRFTNSTFNFAGSDYGINGNNTGIRINSDNAQIINCTFHNNYYGIFLYQTEFSLIANNTFTNNLLHGMFISSSTNNSITDNIIAHNLVHGISMGSSSNYNNISNNQIYNNSDMGISTAVSYYNNIFNNTIHDNTNLGIKLFLSDNNEILSNIIYNHGMENLDFDNSDQNLIYNNTIFNSSWSGIWLRVNAIGNKIYNNTIYANDYDGIRVYSPNHTISDNEIFNNNQRGISLSSNSNNNIIERNIIYNNGIYGIWLNAGSSNNISGNEIFYNSNHGIYLTTSSNNNDFYGNLIYNNTKEGIRLESFSSNNSITSNFIANNSDYGIYLIISTGDNNISWNIYINNNGGTTQAYDDGSSNSFSFNFWNEWDTPDTNPVDGYVDTPYTIDGSAGSSDNFPHAYPYIPREPISITDNSDFETLGFSGNGTNGDPYVIEGYIFTNSTTNLIHIQNTTAFFIIRNNLLNGINGSNNGIWFENVTNGVIDHNILSSNSFGIWINVNSSLGNISDNIIYNQSNRAIGLHPSVANFSIERNYIYNNSRGIYLGASNVTVSGNILTNTSNGFGGAIVIYYPAKNIDIWNNTVSFGAYGIGISFSSFAPAFCRIYNNTIYNTSLSALSLYKGENNTIFDNIIYNSGSFGIELFFSHSNTVFNNTVYANTDHGIYLNCSVNNVINSNIINANLQDAIRLENASYNNVSANIIFDNIYHGIYLFNSSNNNLISGNIIYNNSFISPSGGIGLFSSVNNTISFNSAYNNSNDGIYLLSSSNNNTINGNTLYNNFYDGIFLNISINNSIYQNNIYNNSFGGIWLHFFAYNNTIYYNNIIDNNLYGIGLSNLAEDNYIYRNNIKNNIVNQASDYGTNNVFIYNYWSDWKSPDNNLDGIVDNPYFIFGTANNIDTYPLTYFVINHDPIYIDKNSDFNNLGFPGSGTENDPYLIQGYNITSSSAVLITIGNTTAYFQILNNLLNGINKNYNGIYLRNVTNGIIDNNNIHNSTNGIYLYYSSDNNTITNNIVFNNSNYGIYLASSSSFNIISDNIVNNNAIYGIFISGSSNITISNNLILNSIHGIYQSSSNYNKILNNTISENSQNGIMALSSSNNTIFKNNISFNGMRGILFYTSCFYNQILNNTIYNNTIEGILIRESTNNDISYNDIYNHSFRGILIHLSSNFTQILENNLFKNNQSILVTFSSNNTITNNIIYDNTLTGVSVFNNSYFNLISNNIVYLNSWGIVLNGSVHNNTITGNEVYNNSLSGIGMGYANHNNISSNILYNNSVAGIGINATSEYNTVFKNIIFNNTQFGVLLNNTYNNTVINNTISDNNEYGVFIFSSAIGTLIQWNDFIDNNPTGTSQASDNGTSNIFQYNYWNEWITPDISPPYGIVDKSYSIDGTAVNFDLFPLSISATHVLVGLEIIYPNGGEIVNRSILVQWNTATDSLGHNVSYALYYSSNGGSSWTLLVSGLTNNSIAWNTTSVINGVNYLVQVNVTCTENLWKIDDSNADFTINNAIPDSDSPIIIVFQADISYHELSIGNNLNWTVIDQNPGTFSIWRNNTLVVSDDFWLNNTAALIPIEGLAPGIYNFTAEFKDLNGNSVIDEVWVTVTENTAPEVTVSYPNGGERLSGEITIAWTATDDFDVSALTYVIVFWNGNNWIKLADILNATTYRWNTESVVDRSDYKIRVNASDGYLTGGDDSDNTFTIDNDPTSEQIPAGRTEFQVTDNIFVVIDVGDGVTVTIVLLSEVSTPPPEDANPLGIYLDITLSDTEAFEGLWINISFAELGGQDPTKARLFYYNEESEQWYLVEATDVDFENEVVWGWANHLTLFGVMDVQVQAPGGLVEILILAVIIIVPVVLVSIFIYRKTKGRLRLKKTKKKIRKAQIDLGLIEDIETD